VDRSTNAVHWSIPAPPDLMNRESGNEDRRDQRDIEPGRQTKIARIAAAHKQIGNTEKYQQEYGGPEIAMNSLWFIFRQYWFPLRQNSWNDVHNIANYLLPLVARPTAYL